MSKKTPLYQFHLNHEGRMVEFGGYLLPVNYSKGIKHEHFSVREDVGLFDVSHMAEIFLKGDKVKEFLNHLLTNDFSKMKPGQIKYTLMLNHEGGIVDDLLVYYDDEQVMLVCNASNHQKDVEWIKSQLTDGIELNDLSEEIGLLALQGPNALKVLKQITNEEDIPQKYYTFKGDVLVAGKKVHLSKTGYTGEDGFEIYCHAADVEHIANKLLETGEVELCGLGARDTLRLEAALPLYGHEMDDSITPFDTNLGFFTKMNKDDFIGKKALESSKHNKTRVGLKMIDRGIAREECVVYKDDKVIGKVTSGTQLPYVGYAGAMAIIDQEHSEIGNEVIVDVRGRKLKAEIIELPFYTRKKEEK